MNTFEFRKNACKEIFDALKDKGYQPKKSGEISLCFDEDDAPLDATWEDYDKFTDMAFTQTTAVREICVMEDCLTIYTFPDDEVHETDMTCEEIEDLLIAVRNNIPPFGGGGNDDYDRKVLEHDKQDFVNRIELLRDATRDALKDFVDSFGKDGRIDLQRYFDECTPKASVSMDALSVEHLPDTEAVVFRYPDGENKFEDFHLSTMVSFLTSLENDIDYFVELKLKEK